MTEEYKKMMAEQFGKLPPELQQAIRSPKLGEDVRKIGESNHLHLDQIGLLEDEVLYLLMGFTEPAEFVATMAKELNLQQPQAEQIASAVGSQIIEPIRNSMKASDLKQPAAPQAAPTSVPAPKPVEAHPADFMLTQTSTTAAPTPAPAAPKPAPAMPAPAQTPAPKVEVAKPEAPKPKPYTADPYREPTT